MISLSECNESGFNIVVKDSYSLELKDRNYSEVRLYSGLRINNA